MKSRIIGALLCVLVLGATFWLITRAPVEPPQSPETSETETYVPPQQIVETEISRTYVIETAHNAEDIFEKPEKKSK